MANKPKKEVNVAKKCNCLKVILTLILCFAVVAAVGYLGYIFTASETAGAWYQGIKPSITPANSVFPIVWTILFFLIGLSLTFALLKSKGENKAKITMVFSLNLLLNILWSAFFFTLKNSWLAFIDLALLWLTILGAMIVTWKVSKLSAWLLLPYLLWVTFAGVLNFLVMIA